MGCVLVPVLELTGEWSATNRATLSSVLCLTFFMCLTQFILHSKTFPNYPHLYDTESSCAFSYLLIKNIAKTICCLKVLPQLQLGFTAGRIYHVWTSCLHYIPLVLGGHWKISFSSSPMRFGVSRMRDFVRFLLNVNRAIFLNASLFIIVLPFSP